MTIAGKVEDSSDYGWAVYPPAALTLTIRKVCEAEQPGVSCNFPFCRCGMSERRPLTMLLSVYLEGQRQER